MWRRVRRIWRPSLLRASSGACLSSRASAQQLEAALQTKIARYGAMRPRPISLAEVIETSKPWSVAKFMQQEYPVRAAERILMIESIEHWERVPELAEVHAVHTWAFQKMLCVERKPSLEPFTEFLNEIRSKNREHLRLLSVAMHKLSKDDRSIYDAAFVDRFLDNFFSNRLSTSFAALHYLALCDQHRQGMEMTGIVDLRCDVAEVCRSAARDIQSVCRRLTSRVPVIDVEARSVAGGDEGSPRLAYVPSFLRYILQEILKNSCRATLDHVTTASELLARPIRISVCADEHRVLICIQDRAGGIPFDDGQHVWSYLYTTAGTQANSLAGFGVGLPMSRLYARYLGGSLNLVSLPGLGTHTYIYLPRISSEQVEVIPTDIEFRHTDRKFVL